MDQYLAHIAATNDQQLRSVDKQADTDTSTSFSMSTPNSSTLSEASSEPWHVSYNLIYQQ